MNPALIEIVLSVVKEKYVTEKAFYAEKLGITSQSWDRFKKGEQGLKYENIKILSNLFTDYEWMLVQKVVRNAELLPEVMANPVKEYIYLKYQIARRWIHQGMARLEWHHTELNAKDSGRKSNMMLLQVIADYHVWGYSDVLELRLPGVIRQQIETDEIKLLEWFDHQLNEGNSTV